MNMQRRSFLKATAAAGAAGMIPVTAGALTIPDPPQRAQLKICCQDNIPPGESLTEKLDFLEKHGFDGVEPQGRGLLRNIGDYQKELTNRNIKVSAICAGFRGNLISDQQEDRDLAVKTMKEQMQAGSEIGSTGLIIVPAFNNQPQYEHSKSREVLIDLLGELGEYGESVNCPILLEPLNRKEAYFLRQVADAASICRDVDSPGVACMADFWHMTWEETSDMGAIVSAGKYLHHMHIASRTTRKMPGEEPDDNYVDGMRGMKVIGYRDYLSLECGSIGDKNVTIPAAARLMRAQWEMA